MGSDIISALISIVIALIVAIPLGETLRKHPIPFYFAALVLVAAHLTYRYMGAYVKGAQMFVDIMQKGYLPCAFLAIVMFIGVMGESSKLRHRLQPIRAELSIISFLLILSHVIAFLPSYLPRLGRIFANNTSLSVSIIVAILLILIYALLSVTSLHILRVKVPYKVWKGIQRMSYAMVALLYLHILLALGRSVFVGHGSGSAAFALGVYTVIVVVYAVLRIRKALTDRKAHASVAGTATGTAGAE